jgi:hypothetical protein
MQLSQSFSRDTASPGASALSNAWAVRAVEYVTLRQDADLDKVLSEPVLNETAAREAFGRLVATSQKAENEDLESLRTGWAATVCLAAADQNQPPLRDQWLELAVRYLRLARRNDPYNPFHAQRLMDALDALGRRDEARAAARDLLEVDALQRLDRAVRGLSEHDRARAERIAGGATPAQGSGVSPNPTSGGNGR